MSKRTANKEAADVVRQQLNRERRRQRTVWVSTIALGALVVTGLVGWAVVAITSEDVVYPPGAAGADNPGITAGTGPVRVDIYTDFLCPVCGQYEGATKTTLDRMIDENQITLVFHPVAYLDDSSSNQYSTRSSAAAACAAEGGKFREYSNALFANQPFEGGAGLSDDRLIELGSEIGVTDPAFADCVRDGKYQPWTRYVTDKAKDRGVSEPPTIYVNNQQIEVDPAALTQAVASAG